MTERDFLLQPHSSRLLNRNRHAFTLLEMLVVIGVILVLVAISVLAFGKLENGTKATRVALANCQSMLTEYESAGGDIRLLNGYTSSPGNVNSTDRVAAMNNMKLIMQILLRNPDNKVAMARIPAKQQISLNDPNFPFTVPADAWKNPIVFVSGTGLSNITVGGVTLTPTDPDPKKRFVRPSSGRPFFASAGPDGDFTTGDDNVYSFEN